MACHKIQVFSGACFPHITCFTVLLHQQHNHVKPICVFPNCSLCLYNCTKLFALLKICIIHTYYFLLFLINIFQVHSQKRLPSKAENSNSFFN